MDSLSPKDLKKLADSCRKAGIKSFKGYGVEFTLSDDAPVSNYKRTKGNTPQPDNGKAFESDTLSEEALLMWSSGALGDDLSRDES